MKPLFIAAVFASGITAGFFAYALTVNALLAIEQRERLARVDAMLSRNARPKDALRGYGRVG